MKPSTFDLPFDQFQRYHLIAQVLDRVAGGKELRVLDVGGHPGLLCDFVPTLRVTVADRVSCGTGSVVANGSKLPFPRGAFDVAVSSDTLEHVPPAARRAFVAEIVRVSRGAVLIAAPFADPAVMAADIALHEFIRNTSGVELPFLTEHIHLGLPDAVEVKDWLRSLGATVAEVPNGHLPNWILMMAVTFFLQADERYGRLLPVVSRLYNRTLADSDNVEPCYRRLLVCGRAGLDPSRLVTGLAETGRREASLHSGFGLLLLSELMHHAAGRGAGTDPADNQLLLQQVGYLAARLHDRDRERMAREQDETKLRAGYTDLEGHVKRITDDLASAQTYAQRLESALANEKEAHAEARASCIRQETMLVDLSREHGKVEAHARGLEEHNRRLEVELEAARPNLARGAELERELATSRDQIQTLRTHADNLSGIVGRLQASLVNRLIRRLRGA